MYKFSVPMPYCKEDIDKILDINNQVQKSKITSLYACVPRGCEVFTGFEQSRNFAFDIVSWDYWKGLVEYVLEKGCDFIYLLNSPRPLDIENPNFPKQLEKLELLLTELRKIGVNKLRIASAQLMTYIGKHYPDFGILASTSLEYKTIWEYQNFIHFHPEVKQIVPSHDVNKNFLLLKNLRKRYPNMELELMVNEGCMRGCPHRIIHENINVAKKIYNNEILFSTGYSSILCNFFENRNIFYSLCFSNNIYPWEIIEYSKFGINNFKLVGRDGFQENIEKYINSYTKYLRGIDNIKNIENFAISDFIHHLNNKSILQKITVKEYIKYLPQIKYFKRHGHLCASYCTFKCNYCYNCAEKINKQYDKSILITE